MELFKKQTVSDKVRRPVKIFNTDSALSERFLEFQAIDDLAAALGADRSDLNVHASSKGLVFGKIRVMLHEGAIECDSSGDQVRSH